MKRVPVTQAVPLRDPLQSLCVADPLVLFGDLAKLELVTTGNLCCLHESCVSRMQSVKEFPYSEVAVSKRTRALATALLFVAAAFFFWWGEGASLFEHRHGAKLSGEQNLTFNCLSAIAFLILDFLNLFWILKKEPTDPTSVFIFDDRIIAPKAGCFGQASGNPSFGYHPTYKTVSGWSLGVQCAHSR
jgi:hypothetical protein